MSADATASGEVYILPSCMPSSENNICVLNKNAVAASGRSQLEGSSEQLFEIRVTEMPPDLEESMDQQNRFLSLSANEFASVMKHQEIDLDALNQLLSKDLVCMSSPSGTETAAVKTAVKPQTQKGEVRKNRNVPIVMYSKDGCVYEDSIFHPDETFHDANFASASLEEGDSENYIMFSNDVESVPLLGMNEADNHIWVTETGDGDSARSEPENNNGTYQKVDYSNIHLVPMKVDGEIVYIESAPSATNTQTESIIYDGKVAFEDVADVSSISGGALQNRPSVISIAMKSVSDTDDHTITDDNKQLEDVSGLLNNTVCNTAAAKSSRSILKAPTVGRPTRIMPHRGKTKGTYTRKEEHFSSLINQSKGKPTPKLHLIKNTGIKSSKTSVKNGQSLAVVAISSDKTKDLTEIVLSTSQGEQVFKGKTSELISATPNLWRLNNPRKSSYASMLSYDESSQSSQNSDTNSHDEDDPVNEQPLSDALSRLGIPPLEWIQDQPEDDRLWFCPEKDCKRLFSELQLLKVHILGHYGVRPYKCDFPKCQWSFYSHFKLKRHKETHLQRKDYKCFVPSCGRTFTTIYNLKTHQKLHKRPAEIPCSVEHCNELFQTRRSLEFHLRKHGLDHAPYVCPYTSCQKRYYTVNSVNSHIRSHQHRDDEICCQWPGCTKVFNKPCRLKAHMRTHTGDKPYVCTFEGCSWAFSTSSKLKRHEQKHTNLRKFECDVDGCGKMFLRSEHLKEHILTHSSERTFHCPYPNCNVKFSAKSSLYVHSKKHKLRVHAVSSTEVSAEQSLIGHGGLIPDAMDAIIANECSETVVDAAVEQVQVPTVIEYASRARARAPVPAPIVCSVEQCGQTFLSTLDLQEHVVNFHSNTMSVADTAEQLDLIPLMAEDDVLVSELASIEQAPFTNDSSSNIGSTNNAPPVSVVDNAIVLNSLPSFIDDAKTLSNGAQVVLSCDEDGNYILPAQDLEDRDEDMDHVLHPGSARSSITIDRWLRFKKERQRQINQPKTSRSFKRPTQQPAKLKKPEQQEDLTGVQLTKVSQEAISNVRALDVVLGAGLLGSSHDIAHLLLPDELAASSDLYSGEDGILNMDSSFVPSTINLRDLE